MFSTRRVAASAVDVCCRLVGRRQMVRVGRFVLNRARLDLPNDPAANGEWALQRWLLDAIDPAQTVTVLDVGANVGCWSMAMLARARGTGHVRVVAHAFEPAPACAEILRSRLPGDGRVNEVAVSDATGEATLYVTGPVAGTNTLHGDPGAAAGGTWTVRTTTIDEYAERNGIDRVDLMKVDTEGHDLAVLRGARALLGSRRITVIQFEYNHRWVFDRRYLKDAFDLLQPYGYRIGKLTPYGVEYYPRWDPELETYIEGNYVANAGDHRIRLPEVAWWKRANPPTGTT